MHGIMQRAVDAFRSVGLDSAPIACTSYCFQRLKLQQCPLQSRGCTLDFVGRACSVHAVNVSACVWPARQGLSQVTFPWELVHTVGLVLSCLNPSGPSSHFPGTPTPLFQVSLPRCRIIRPACPHPHLCPLGRGFRQVFGYGVGVSTKGPENTGAVCLRCSAMRACTALQGGQSGKPVDSEKSHSCAHCAPTCDPTGSPARTWALGVPSLITPHILDLHLCCRCCLQWRCFQADRTSIFDKIIGVIGNQIEKQQDENACLAYWCVLSSGSRPACVCDAEYLHRLPAFGCQPSAASLPLPAGANTPSHTCADYTRRTKILWGEGPQGRHQVLRVCAEAPVRVEILPSWHR